MGRVVRPARAAGDCTRASGSFNRFLTGSGGANWKCGRCVNFCPGKGLNQLYLLSFRQVVSIRSRGLIHSNHF